MRLSTRELLAWDVNSLRVSRRQHTRLMFDLTILISAWRASVPRSSPFEIVKFRRAGSLQKATALRPRTKTDLDVDVAVYLDSSRESDYDLPTVHATLRAIVRRTHPRLSDSDFCVQPHTLGVQFNEPHLMVDLVPVMISELRPKGGRMMSSGGGLGAMTSMRDHITYVEGLAQMDNHYRPLVRMVKVWRDNADLRRELSSFAVELLLAHLQMVHGPAVSLEEGLQRFFLFIAQSDLREPILLGHSTVPDDRVVILDPANEANNVAAHMLESERFEIVTAATTAWETLLIAHHTRSREETYALWQEVFGERFPAAAVAGSSVVSA